MLQQWINTSSSSSLTLLSHSVPLKPGTHTHWKWLSLSRQVAPLRQGLDSHSSISASHLKHISRVLTQRWLTELQLTHRRSSDLYSWLQLRHTFSSAAGVCTICCSHLAPVYPGLQVQFPPELPPIQTPPLRHSVFASHATGGKRHLNTHAHILHYNQYY